MAGCAKASTHTWPVRPVECERRPREIRRKIFGIARASGGPGAPIDSSSLANVRRALRFHPDPEETIAIFKCSKSPLCTRGVAMTRTRSVIDRKKNTGQRLRHVHEAFCHSVCRFGFQTNNPLISSLHPDREASGSLATRHDRLDPCRYGHIPIS